MPSNAIWLTPVSDYRRTSPFGMRVHPVLAYKRMHNGVDMACARGTPIYATRAGKVTAASYLAGGAGISTGPNLHLGISYAGTYVNPLAYIY